MTGPTPGPPEVIDVSIIVIAYDVRDEVLSCLRSIEAHGDGTALETILVDNGSHDGTAQAVKRTFPAVTVVRREANEGMHARNYGLRLARGRHRMFLDSDAKLTEGALRELVAFLDAHPQVGLVGPRLEYPDGTPQPSARRFPPLLLPLLRRPPLNRFLEHGKTVRRHTMANDPQGSTREVEYVLGACQLFTAEAQAAAGAFDPRIFYGPDDADWCLRIRRHGWKVAFHPAATVIHDYRRATNSRPVSRLAFEHLKAHLLFHWKWRHARAALARDGREIDRRDGRLDSSPPLRGRPQLGLDWRAGESRVS